MVAKDDDTFGEEEWQENPTVTGASVTCQVDVGSEDAALVVLIGDPRGRAFTLREDEALLGRGPEASVRLAASDISRRHARIFRGPGGTVLIEDLGSANGTRLAGTPVTGPRELKFGDRLQIGAHTVLVFTHHSPLEEQVLEQQKLEAIGRLAGGIAHEFNNLLAVIRSNVTLLLEQIPARQIRRHDVVECLQDVDGAAADAANLTAQLVGFSQHGKHAEQRFDLSPVIRNAARLLADASLRKVQIDIDLPGPLLVRGDRVQLQQMVMALGLNGCDAMTAGGRLSIGGRRLSTPPADAHGALSGPVIQLALSDTGPGMDAETCSQIFEPFFGNQDRGRGGGLGLATVYGIVRSHGGQIKVDSMLGEGSTFSIYLPAADRDVQDRETKTSTHPQIPVNGGTLLIIDDDPLVLKASARVVKRLGFDSLCARSGKEGVQLFLEHRGEIRLVLLDLVMPEMNGEETFDLLRQIDSDLGVLLVSGYGSDEMISRMLSGGAAGLVKKPFSIETLRDAIGRALAGERDIRA